MNDIPRIEHANNLKINVHVWRDNRLIGIRYNNPHVIAPRTINILLITKGTEYHYCGITSLRSLYYHTKRSHVNHFCERCCRHFKSKNRLEEHYQHCSQGRLQIERLPKDRTYQYFQFSHELSPVVILYADLECYISPAPERRHHAAAVAMLPVWHSGFRGEKCDEGMRLWNRETCIVDFLRNWISSLVIYMLMKRNSPVSVCA